MAWLRVELTEAERTIVTAERDDHPDPLVRRRLRGVWMLHCGAKHEAAANYLGVSLSTLQRDVALYKKGGLAALRKSQRLYVPVSDLEVHAETIRADLERQPARTVAELGDRIAKLTGVVRRPTQIRAFAKRLGLKWLRVHAIPVPPKKNFPNTSPTRMLS